jgi:mRNA-degrading endonuclease RelE of RelBE toxin-antitoxin system
MSSLNYEVRITRRAEKDIKKLTPKLKRKLYDILTEVIAKDPAQEKRLGGVGSVRHPNPGKGRSGLNLTYGTGVEGI